MQGKTIEKTDLTIGNIAPDFTLNNQNGEPVNLYSVLNSGKNVMLVFYPGDNTPGCTMQLCSIRDIYKEFEKKNISVFGINHADEKSHAKFIEKQNYQFPILVDTNKEISQLYGQIKLMFGHKSIKRAVYVINVDKTIVYKKNGYQDNEEVLRLF